MLIVYTDGACFGNPGTMGIGIVVYKNKKLIKKISEYIGKGTNNIAEYIAVLKALEYVKKSNEKKVEIRSDSELLIKQMNNEYKVKKQHLKELKTEINRIKEGIETKFKWVKREENSIADELSKNAIFEKQKQDTNQA